MKKKNIFILLFVLGVFVLAAFIMEGPIGKRKERKAAKESILFPGFETDRVASVEISAKDREVRLDREGDSWVVATSDNYPADAEAVETMLDRVGDFRAAFTASRSAEKHSLFEVDESGIEVKMLGTAEDVLAHLFIGKLGPGMSSYIRKADQDTVHKVDGYVGPIFDKADRGWRDRTIFDFDASQVQRLTLISQDKGEVAIEALEGGGWQIVSPEVVPAEDAAVGEIVRDIAGLSADDFADEEDPEEYKLEDPQSKAMVDLKDGTARILLVGGESGYRRYVKREGKETVFLLSKSKIDRIFKDELRQ